MKLVRVRLRQPHMQVSRATAVDLGASIPGTLNMRGGYQTSTAKQPTLAVLSLAPGHASAHHSAPS